MTHTHTKEYIKNLIINGLEGKKINKAESEELERAVLNFDQTEWRNFKIIGKEAVKEFIDKKMDEEIPQMPSEWRGEFKNFLHALINLASALASEEIIVESTRLEKAKTPWEQRIKVLVPLYTKQLEKIAARKPARKINNYHKAEVSLVKKVKQLKSMYQMAKMMGRKPTSGEVLGAVKEVISLSKNLSAEEIAVAKEKGKSLVNDYVNRHASAELQQYPELKPLIKSFIGFWDALLEEKLLAEGIKLGSEMIEISLKYFDFEQLNQLKNPWEAMKYGASLGEKIGQELRKKGMENRSRQLMVNWTNHINRLASEEFDNNNLSATEEQSIAQKLATSRELSGDNSTENTGNGLSFLSPGSVFNSIEGDNSASKGDFWEELDKKFTTVESKGKWYKNPWFIGFSIVGVLAVGGLLVWWLTRRKEERRVDKERTF